MMGDTGGGKLVEAFKGSTKEGIRMKSSRQQLVSAYRGDRGMDYTRKVCSPAFRRPEPAKAGTTNADLSFIQRSRQYGPPESSRELGGLEELRYDSGRTQYTFKDGRVVHITER
ncbi:MAG: hypothetical protein HY735_22145 [Verrucomicrobia bacterium]|nr:hypothetical protein [Verrucomicrobiota bacterium]